jgi:hypothetical protein
MSACTLNGHDCYAEHDTPVSLHSFKRL